MDIINHQSSFCFINCEVETLKAISSFRRELNTLKDIMAKLSVKCRHAGTVPQSQHLEGRIRKVMI
jgi:hypothetical protein